MKIIFEKGDLYKFCTPALNIQEVLIQKAEKRHPEEDIELLSYTQHSTWWHLWYHHGEDKSTCMVIHEVAV